MRFNDRKDWLFDPLMFGRQDTQTALRIHAEYVLKFSPKPAPKFLEVDQSQPIDTLWHVPVNTRTSFSREIDMPAINQFLKPDWRLTSKGITPQRQDRFWLANLMMNSPEGCDKLGVRWFDAKGDRLPQFDYFPTRGDFVAWNGYRYMVYDVVLPPEAYWGQTGVWLGMYVDAIIVPEGDARPLEDVMKLAIAERGKPEKVK